METGAPNTQGTPAFLTGLLHGQAKANLCGRTITGGSVYTCLVKEGKGVRTHREMSEVLTTLTLPQGTLGQLKFCLACPAFLPVFLLGQVLREEVTSLSHLFVLNIE